MAQLLARPGRNAARQAKKAKEIRHVKGAIIWHEKKRLAHKQKMHDWYDHKLSKRYRREWDLEQVIRVRQKALRNAAEDWKLGPLRPNRAVHVADGKYAVTRPAQVTKPEITVKFWKRENDFREKKGLVPAYPLIVDDQKYFPIVKGDRVVVTKGSARGKIGTVQNIIESTHDVFIQGINMVSLDSDLFKATGQDFGPSRTAEKPVPLDDLRLVIPYASASFTANGQSIYEDVVVDNVIMERHTTGIDPFTGTDYGSAEIPAQHQYDPETGRTIFHRYIAGTRYRIAWPWESESKAADSTLPTPNKKAAQGWLSKTLGTLRHPITTLQSWRNPTTKKPAKRAPSTLPLALQVDNIEASERRKQRRAGLRSADPEQQKEAHDVVDTTRNIVEGSESMSYTLVAPPFPETLTQELRSDIFEMTQKARKDTDAPHVPVRTKYISPKAQAAQQFAQKKAQAAERMKTPMQLRWEQEQAKKQIAKTDSPAVDTDTLLAALGQHMLANGVRSTKKKQQASQAELD